MIVSVSHNGSNWCTLLYTSFAISRYLRMSRERLEALLGIAHPLISKLPCRVDKQSKGALSYYSKIPSNRGVPKVSVVQFSGYQLCVTSLTRRVKAYRMVSRVSSLNVQARGMISRALQKISTRNGISHIVLRI